MARTAHVLGRPFIPWQRHVADVAGELRPDGRFRYSRVPLIVPRRAGKTWFILCYLLTVLRLRRAGRGFYASHRRETAAAMWRDDWFPAVELSPLHPMFVTIRKANGSEAILWRHYRSTLRLLPPDGDAMRSFASDVAVIDEGREFGLEQGIDFENAVFPTQATGLGGQTFIISSAPNRVGRGEWLARWRDIGRAAVERLDSQIAYFEWAAPPGLDPADPATWRLAHPGLGFHVLADALALDAETMAPDDFAGEYLGWWPETQVDNELVDAWLSPGCARDRVAPADPVVFAVELDEDRTRCQIVAAGTDPNAGAPAVELLVDRDHGDWVTGELTRLAATHHPQAIVWDRGGPVGALAHDLADVPANLTPFDTRDVAAACGAFHDAILARRVVHGPDDVLDEAITAARRRRAGGAWLFDRRQPGAGPLIAAALAHWGHTDRRRAPPNVA
ncbi:MAG TPA: hypothetical protein VIX41_08880 [Acidimicrobiales bacterium]